MSVLLYILQLSELKMYQIHYDVMKKVYPDSLMLKTDTDSLLYHMHTNDLYKHLKSNELLQQHIEFSNYSKNHALYNNDHKKQIGILQVE